MSLTKNQFVIRGFVGNEPVISENGKTRASLSIATTKYFTSKKGENKKITDWLSVVAWGGLAETIRDKVKTGQLLEVEGKIKPASYENKEGQKVYTLDLTAEKMTLLTREKKQ
jgi:single-strand DNA-binding protein